MRLRRTGTENRQGFWRWLEGRRGASASHSPTDARHVRVNVEPKGFGLALTIDEDAAESNGDTDGILHVSNACVTLELLGPKGRRSVLAWDPAEVEWSSLQAG